MAKLAFTTMLIAGPALLAFWADLRLGERRPKSPGARVFHALVAFALLQGVSVAFTSILRGDAPLGERMAAFLVLYLPGLLYASLGALWLLRTLADVAHVTRR
jgi:hypothetical protein